MEICKVDQYQLVARRQKSAAIYRLKGQNNFIEKF